MRQTIDINTSQKPVALQRLTRTIKT